jgi:hypothetical protein
MKESGAGPAQDQYIQISPNIFRCLSQVRPPIDYHFLDVKTGAVKRLHPAGQRVPKDLAPRLEELCNAGDLFLRKSDYRAFAQGLSKNLGALATEETLNPEEVAGIFYHALAVNLGEFILQPLGQPYAQLVKDTAILCEYVWAAPKRVLPFPRVLGSEHKLALQSSGTCLTGLAILTVLEQGKTKPVVLARMALGLLLHDIGMENVIVTKLGKEGPLLNAERASIKNHTVVGGKILDRLRQQKVEIPPEAEQCVKEHHERYTGKGYPLALRGDNISLAGRLCAVADSYAAMLTNRPHAKALPPAKAAEILAGDEGYDPALTRILLKLAG